MGTPVWSPGRLVGSPSERIWWWPRGWQAPPACVGHQGRAPRPRSSLKRPRVLQALLLQVRKPFTPKTASRLRDAPSRASLLLRVERGEAAPFVRRVAANSYRSRLPRREVFINFLFSTWERYKGVLFFLFYFLGTIVIVTSLKKGYILILGGTYTVRKDLQAEKSWEARDNRGEKKDCGGNSHYRSLIFFSITMNFLIRKTSLCIKNRRVKSILQNRIQNWKNWKRYNNYCNSFIYLLIFFLISIKILISF